MDRGQGGTKQLQLAPQGWSPDHSLPIVPQSAGAREEKALEFTSLHLGDSCLAAATITQ